MARRVRRAPWFRSSRLLLVGASLFSFGCGEDDPAPKNEGPVCPHDNTTVLTVTGVSPALGSTNVSNTDIVHTFTTVGVEALQSLIIRQLPTHTAGAAPGFSGTALQSGADVVYTINPFAWPTAPGHVALFEGGLYIDPDGCKLAFPNPLFEYDIVP